MSIRELLAPGFVKLLAATMLASGLVACGGGAPPAVAPEVGSTAPVDSSKTISFSQKPTAIDDVIEWSKTQDTHIVFTDNQTPKDVRSERSYSVAIRILDVEAGKPTEIVAYYPDQVDSQSIDGGAPNITHELKDHRYLLKRPRGGELTGARTDGGPPSADEVAFIRSHHGRLGEPWTLFSFFVTRPWTVDVPVTLTADELATYMNADDVEEPKVQEMIVTLTSFDDTTATFSISGRLLLDAPASGTNVDMQWTAESQVLRDNLRSAQGWGTSKGTGTMNGRPISFELSQKETILRGTLDEIRAQKENSATP